MQHRRHVRLRRRQRLWHPQIKYWIWPRWYHHRHHLTAKRANPLSTRLRDPILVEVQESKLICMVREWMFVRVGVLLFLSPTPCRCR